MPAFSLIFGDLVDQIGANTSFMDVVEDMALRLVYVGIGVFIVSYIEVAALTISAERQIRKIREQYVAAILRQEIAWHDGSSPGEVATRVSRYV